MVKQIKAFFSYFLFGDIWEKHVNQIRNKIKVLLDGKDSEKMADDNQSFDCRPCFRLFSFPTILTTLQSADPIVAEVSSWGVEQRRQGSSLEEEILARIQIFLFTSNWQRNPSPAGCNYKGQIHYVETLSLSWEKRRHPVF